MFKELLEVFHEIKETILFLWEITFHFFFKKFGLKEVPKTQSEHTQKDMLMIHLTHQLIINHFGSKPYEVVQKLTPKERLALSELFIADLKKLYGFEVQVEHYFDADSLIFGLFYEQTNTIHMNTAYLLSGTPNGIECYIKTCIHEMRHKIQCMAIDIEGYWDTPTETKEAWKYEYSQYISSNDDFELYYNQNLERDARSFSEKAVEG